MSKQPIAPCYKCKERVVGCHSKCEKYLEFSEVVRAERENRLAENERVHKTFSARTDNYVKTKKE